MTVSLARCACVVHSRGVSELTDRLIEARGDRSVDSIVKRMEDAGCGVNRATVYRYLNGKVAKQPDEPTLQALSVGFGVGIRELRRLAGLPEGEPGEWTPPDEARRLNREQRDALDQLIRAIVRGSDSHGSAPSTRAGVSPAGNNLSQVGLEGATFRQDAGSVQKSGRSKSGRPRRPPAASGEVDDDAARHSSRDEP